MHDPYLVAWAILLFSSIAWYAFLVFYIGIKAGKELLVLIKHLSARRAETLRAKRDTPTSP